MNRRTFLSGAAAAVVVGATPAQGARRSELLRGGRFSEGVASGDPTPHGITLATRLAGVEGTGAVTLEIARDKGFGGVVARSRLTTGPGLGHAIKGRVSGLRPHTQYYYRFAGRTAHSPVGRFRTALPDDSRQVVQFGVIYGIEHAAGYFNALALLADEDVDFVLNLGNYVCADPSPSADGVRPPYDLVPARSLKAYRARYREYRTDASLRRLHATHALVSTWDDREVAAGYAGRDTAASLKAAAYRAWFEAMPHYPKEPGVPRVYTGARFGRTLDVYVCDTRQYRVPAPGSGTTDLLGRAQSRLLRGRLKASRATWKLVASPAPMATPDPQGWPGYQRAREELLATLAANRVQDVAFLTGARRRFVAADVTDARGAVIAPEFGVGSVSQRTELELGTPGAPVDNAREDDAAHHGYAVYSASRDLLTVRFEKLSTIRSASSATDPRSVYQLPKGSRSVQDA